MGPNEYYKVGLANYNGGSPYGWLERPQQRNVWHPQNAQDAKAALQRAKKREYIEFGDPIPNTDLVWTRYNKANPKPPHERKVKQVRQIPPGMQTVSKPPTKDSSHEEYEEGDYESEVSLAEEPKLLDPNPVSIQELIRVPSLQFNDEVEPLASTT